MIFLDLFFGFPFHAQATLAAFAGQGKSEAALLESLLGDTVLMRDMLLAGGAKGGMYGQVTSYHVAQRAGSPVYVGQSHPSCVRHSRCVCLCCAVLNLCRCVSLLRGTEPLLLCRQTHSAVTVCISKTPRERVNV